MRNKDNKKPRLKKIHLIFNQNKIMLIKEVIPMIIKENKTFKQKSATHDNIRTKSKHGKR